MFILLKRVFNSFLLKKLDIGFTLVHKKPPSLKS